MATKMLFSSQNCQGVTSGATGKTYNTDSKGFIHVEDKRDVKSLAEGGYVVAGTHMAGISKSFVCDDCAWTAVLNHCPKCDSNDLRRVEA
jgi:hypothetical protein